MPLTREQIKTSISNNITDDLLRQNTAEVVREQLDVIIDNCFNLAEDDFDDTEINFDSIPISGSQNPVTSDGIFDALETLDNSVVHNTGDEDVDGTKTFTSPITGTDGASITNASPGENTSLLVSDGYVKNEYENTSTNSKSIVSVDANGVGIRGAIAAFIAYLKTTNLSADSVWEIPDEASATFASRAYVLAQIAAIVDSSPAALDTLNELAAALGDDANFATTITNALALKAPLMSPALVTPNLGTPSAGTLTNCSGLPTSGVVGYQGYSLQAGTPQFNPSGTNTYFAGFVISTVASTGGLVGIPIIKTGIIKRVDVVFTNSGTLSSNETSSVYIRINDTTDTLISNAVVADATRKVFSGVVSIPVTEGVDYFEIKWVKTTNGTNPTNIRMNAIVYIE